MEYFRDTKICLPENSRQMVLFFRNILHPEEFRVILNTIYFSSGYWKPFMNPITSEEQMSPPMTLFLNTITFA